MLDVRSMEALGRILKHLAVDAILIMDYPRKTHRRSVSVSESPARITAFATRQYAKIVDGWVASIGLDPNEYGTHTMRRTKATLIYRRTKNLRAVQLLLGHTKLESTVRYLGIEVDDALEIAEQTEV
jgi:integrase